MASSGACARGSVRRRVRARKVVAYTRVNQTRRRGAGLGRRRAAARGIVAVHTSNHTRFRGRADGAPAA